MLCPLIYTCLLPSATSGQATRDSLQAMPNSKVLRILATCPDYREVIKRAQSSGTERARYQDLLDKAMRELQDTPTGQLEAIALDLFRNVAVEDYEISQGQPTPGERSRRFSKRQAESAILRNFIWVDRYLFRPVEADGDLRGALLFSIVEPGKVDRIYPLAAGVGAPRLADQLRPTVQYDTPDLPGSYVTEFEYYSYHYPRRTKWWE